MLDSSIPSVHDIEDPDKKVEYDDQSNTNDGDKNLQDLSKQAINKKLCYKFGAICCIVFILVVVFLILKFETTIFDGETNRNE